MSTRGLDIINEERREKSRKRDSSGGGDTDGKGGMAPDREGHQRLFSPTLQVNRGGLCTKMEGGGHVSSNTEARWIARAVGCPKQRLVRMNCHACKNNVSPLLNTAVIKSLMIEACDEIFYIKNKGNDTQSSSLPSHLLYFTIISVHVFIYTCSICAVIIL